MNELTFGSPNNLNLFMNTHFAYADFTKLKSPEQLLHDKRGSCHDQTIYAYEMLKKMRIHPYAIFLMEYDDNNQGGITHSFVYYKDSMPIRKNYHYLESAWGGHGGIWSFESVRSMLKYFEIAHERHEFGNNRKYPHLAFFEMNPEDHKKGETLEEFVEIATNALEIMI